MSTKICTKCKKKKPLDDFRRSAKMKKDGRKSRCKVCQSEDHAEYRARPEIRLAKIIGDRQYRIANREARRAYNRRWNTSDRGREAKRLSEHKRRAQKASLPHEDYTLDQIIRRDGNACWMCGVSGEAVALEIEHLIAIQTDPVELMVWELSNPGDVLANVTLSCRTCNMRKWKRVMICAVARYFRNSRVDRRLWCL